MQRKTFRILLSVLGEEVTRLDRRSFPLSMFSPPGAQNGACAPAFSRDEAFRLAQELGIPQPKNLGDDIWAVVAEITPLIAHNWLSQRDPLNRDVVESHARRISRDITAGKFVLTHESIAFSKDGKLQDGQHRLLAVLMAQKSAKFTIVLNVCDEARMVIDSGRPRRAFEFLQMIGKRSSYLAESTMKRALAGLAPRVDLTRSEMIGYMQRHSRALNWVLKQFPKKAQGIRNAAVLGAVLRAYYHVPRERLQEFCVALCERKARHQSDRAAIVLGDQLIQRFNRRDVVRMDPLAIYGITCRAIKAFVEKESGMTRFNQPTHEIFELPTVGGSEENNGDE